MALPMLSTFGAVPKFKLTNQDSSFIHYSLFTIHDSRSDLLKINKTESVFFKKIWTFLWSIYFHPESNTEEAVL